MPDSASLGTPPTSYGTLLKSPLVRQVSLAVTVLCCIVEAMVFWPLYEDRKHHLYENLVDDQVHGLIAAKKDFEADRDLLSYAESILTSALITDVTGVRIREDATATQVAAGEDPAVLDASTKDQVTEDSSRVDIAIPHELVPAGLALTMRFDHREISRELNKFLVISAATTLLIALSCATLTVVAVIWLVLKPMLVLRHALSLDDESGLPEVRTAASGRTDEIGDVFRTTAKLLEDRARFRADLGQLVLERTMELTAANGRLRTMEAQTRSSAKRIRAILDNSPSFIYLKSVDGRYLLVNKQVEDALGLPADQILGKTHHDFYPEDLTDVYADQDREVVETKTTVVREAKVPRADGSPRSSIIYKFPVFGALGEVESIGAVIVDIEDRVRAEEALKEEKERAEAASRSKSDLIATVSHEVRTPMNGVLGMARLMRGTELDAEQRDTLETVIASGESLLRIVNDLLDISKLEAGHLELEDIPFLPRDVVHGTVSMLGMRAQEKGLQIVSQIDPGVPEVLRGDPYRLRQILVNLVSNAVKFTTQGEITITLTRIGERYEFAVADTGSGISSEARAKLFSPFAQGAIDVARKYGGTGLGLSICRQLVTMMDGEITLDSELGKGSRFAFTIRLPECPDVDPASLRPGTVPKALDPATAFRRPLTVLQVEDNEVNRKLMEKLLQQAGHRVVSVADGRAALLEITEQPFDLVIMDKHMPVMDGLEATRLIRALPPPAGTTPILGMTAGALDYELAACLEAGMDRVLTKPADEIALMATIAHLTEHLAAEALPVLVVDDLEINLKVARKQMENLGVACEVTSDPEHALNLMKAGGYAAALVDKEMPGLDGLELTRRFRDWEGDRPVPFPIVGISGHVSPEDREACLRAGMTAYLTKPVSIEDLRATLTAVKALPAE
jgi:PAS domain S-box-containing protein